MAEEIAKHYVWTAVREASERLNGFEDTAKNLYRRGAEPDCDAIESLRRKVHRARYEVASLVKLVDEPSLTLQGAKSAVERIREGVGFEEWSAAYAALGQVPRLHCDPPPKDHGANVGVRLPRAFNR